MIRRLALLLTGERRAIALAAIIMLQALCAAFFIGDAFLDLGSVDQAGLGHLGLELLVTLALTLGVIVLMIELRFVLRRVEKMECGLRAARGEMTHIINVFFDEWGLTPSERDVAQMIIKGLDNEAIARLRGTASGTVRAQTARIYAKAGVDGRSQLISLFMEELLCGDVDSSPVAEAAQPRVPA